MFKLFDEPFYIKTVHFVGIGGIGMSGIAEIFHKMGYKVQGSDIKTSPSLERLQSLGVKVFNKHEAENVINADIVVYSSAIKHSNEEISKAIELGLPLVQRASMLAELMRGRIGVAIAGSHGKTTTTSIAGSLLSYAGLDPTIVIGGILQDMQSNSYLGSSSWMVAEADESDGSFLNLLPTLAVITNIEMEHVDHYKDLDEIKASFVQFANSVPFYGAAIVCIDDKHANSIIPEIKNRRVITYGLTSHADFYACNIVTKGSTVTYDVHYKLRGKEGIIEGITLPMCGDHNVRNSLACVAVAKFAGVEDETLKQGIASFKGVKRRFTYVDSYKDSAIFDDYAHHPSEVIAVLEGAKRYLDDDSKKIIAVFQPHKYSRLEHFMDEFAQAFKDADVICVVDVYSAGEKSIEGIDSKTLVDLIKSYGYKNAYYTSSFEDASDLISNVISQGDIVINMGAGDITNFSYNLSSLLKAKENA